jgi:hypothetical protein
MTTGIRAFFIFPGLPARKKGNSSTIPGDRGKSYPKPIL